MLPRLVFVLGFAAAVLVDAEPSWAQAAERWPDWLGSPPSDMVSKRFEPPGFPRGAGDYFSIVKILASLAVFWLGLAAADWVNRDGVMLKQNYRLWNALVALSLIVAFVLLWIIPWFALSYTLLVLAATVPTAVYVFQRNKSLNDADKVFTLDHLKHLVSSRLKGVGIKTPELRAKEKLSPVSLVPRGAPTPQDEQVRLIAARQSPGFNAAAHLLHRAMNRRASSLMIDYSAEAAGVRYLIDGVWVDAETQPRQMADPILASLKSLSGLKPEERRNRQQGTFLAVNESIKLKMPTKLTSQGTKNGERVIIQFDDPNLRKRRLPDVGIRQKLQDDLLELFRQPKGLIVLAAPPGGGLTSLTTVCLAAIDRFTRTVMAVEDIRNKDVEVENVPITTYDSLEQETPLTKLPGVIRQFPDVLVVPDVTDSDTLKLLCEEAREERMVITTVRAKEASEALLRPLLTKVSPKSYALAVTAVVAHRLVRKLCESCREAYPPPPQILQRLGISPDKVPAFYRPPTQPRQEVCPECNGIGYKGQTGIIELLPVNDAVRQQIVKEPKVDAVRAVARKAGLKVFEDEGLLLVVKGVTSVQELARVLKEPPPAAAAG